jgi:hypothetical protein
MMDKSPVHAQSQTDHADNHNGIVNDGILHQDIYLPLLK